MEIKTKYNIGDRIWVVKEGSYYDSTENTRKLSGEVEVFDDYISSIEINNTGIYYILASADMIDLEEKNIILYNENDKLIAKIKELMNEIHKREENENEEDKV